MSRQTAERPHDRSLEAWLVQATWRLTPESAARVREEIGAHYEAALADALAAGATEDEARRASLASLGSSAAAGRGYRRQLLTLPEAIELNHQTVAGTALPVRGIKGAICWIGLAGCVGLSALALVTVPGNAKYALTLGFVVPALLFLAASGRGATLMQLAPPWMVTALGLVIPLWFVWQSLELRSAPYMVLGVSLLAFHLYKDSVRRSLRRKLRAGAART